MEITLVSLQIVLSIVNPLFAPPQTAGKGNVNSFSASLNAVGTGCEDRMLELRSLAGRALQLDHHAFRCRTHFRVVIARVRDNLVDDRVRVVGVVMVED